MNALLDYLKQYPALVEEDRHREINRLADRVWTFADPKKGFEETAVDFATELDNPPPAMEVWVKQVLNPDNSALIYVRLVRTETGLLCGSLQGLGHAIDILKVFIYWWKKSGHTKLSLMTHEELIEMFKDVLTRETNMGVRVYPELTSASTMKYLVKQYSKIRQSFLHEELLDGFTPTISETEILDELANTVAPQVIPNFSYPKWKAGRKFDGLPVQQSIALLAACLTHLRSPKTRLVIALHKVQTKRNIRSFPNAWTKALQAGEFLTMHENTKGSNLRHKKSFQEDFCEALGVERFEDVPAELFDVKLDREEFLDRRGGEYKFHFRSLVPTCMVVIAIITGARRNELESIQWGDIYRDEKGDWRFNSKINKTNQGLTTVRYIAGIAAEMVDLLVEISCVTQKDLNGPIFSQLIRKGATRANCAGKNFVSNSLPTVFDQFLNPFLADDLKITGFKMHSVRHAWAEFALRRFDGDSVPELVRQHFRHHFGSYMTKRYLHGKVFEEDGRNLAAEYIAELVGRMVQGDLRMYGPVGQFIREQIDQYTFVGEDEIELIVERFDSQIEPHEYGFCMVRPETVTVAKCYDAQTQMARTNDACFDKCSGCVNRASLPSQAEDIKRLGISVQTSMESFEKMGLIPIANQYKPTLDRAKRALKEIQEGESLHV